MISLPWVVLLACIAGKATLWTTWLTGNLPSEYGLLALVVSVCMSLGILLPGIVLLTGWWKAQQR